MGYQVEGSGISKGNAGTGAAFVCPISALATQNDVAVCVFTRAGGTSATAPSGWQTITLEDNAVSIFYKNMGATPDTSISVPTTATAGVISTFLMRGLDVSTATSAYDSGSYSSTNTSAHPATGPTITPTNTNSSIIMGACEPSGQALIPEHGAKFVTGFHTGSQNQTIIEDFQPTAAATTGYTWRRNHTSITTILVFAFAMVDDGTGKTRAYVDHQTNPICTPIHMMGLNGESGISASDTAAFNPTTAIPNITDGTGASVSTIYDAPLFQANALQGGAFALRQTSNSAAASLCGTILTTMPSLTGKNICFSPKYRLATGLSNYNEVGAYFILSDQTNSRVWMYGGKDTNPNIEEGVYPVVIDPDGGYEWEDIGTVTLANCDTIVVGFNKPSTDNEDLYMSPVVQLETIILEDVGGIPGSMDDIRQITQLNRLNTCINQGGQTKAQFIQFQSFEIRCNWNGDTQSVSFPDAYSEATGKVQAMIAQGSVGGLINVPDGKTVSDRNKVVYGGDYHIYGTKSGTSTHASTSYDFNGAAWVRVTPYLNAINGTIGGLLIADSKEVVYTTLADCSGGVTFSGCVDAQQITIGPLSTQVLLQAEIDKLANNIFRNNAVAIRIEYTGTGDISLNFDGITWSGNTTDIHYHATDVGGSALTAVMANGSNATTSAISGTATGVTIDAPKPSVTITVKDAATLSAIQGARVYLKTDAGGPEAEGTELFNDLTDVNGQVTIAAYDYTSNQPVSGRVRKGSSSPFYKTGAVAGTITASGFDATVFLVSE